MKPNAYSADCPTRQILDRVGDKWAVLILLLIRHEPMRFNALRRAIEGISQKMLSQVLKSLERDGLIRRRAIPTVPVTVEYSITPLGSTLATAIPLQAYELLKNARDEWELPGGKLELSESPETCVAREIAEELRLDVTPDAVLDAWVYTIAADVHVVVLTFGCSETSAREAFRIGASFAQRAEGERSPSG